VSPTPTRHVVVISDAHLSQAHPDDDRDPDWMRYRRREHHPDADLEILIDLLLSTFPDPARDAVELCFNGDVLDFDCPRVEGGRSTLDDTPTDEAGCAEQARRILADHPRWVAAVARLIEAGHRVLFVAGNHDVELAFPAVRAAVLDAIQGATGAPLELASRVRFRGWFHVTEGGVYLEHGSQYDPFNALPHALRPLGADGRVRPTIGKLVFKRIGARLGYFNAFCEDIHYQGVVALAAHVARRYLFGPRHFVRTWLAGALSTVRDVRRARRDDPGLGHGDATARFETGASEAAIRATRALAAEPASQRLHATLRELWLDRAAFVVALAVAAPTGAGVSGALAALGALVAGAALFAAYEVVTPKPDIRTYDSPPDEVERLFDVHGARALCFGHTHRPFGRWRRARFRGNSGSWSPAFHDAACTRRVLDGRPLLLLSSAHGDLTGGLVWLRDGRIVPAAGDAWRGPWIASSPSVTPGRRCAG
jgi:UDP-2,3-diacylglucosamine pyrophosphatase LpxH